MDPVGLKPTKFDLSEFFINRWKRKTSIKFDTTNLNGASNRIGLAIQRYCNALHYNVFIALEFHL